jgi:hypothetical protein
MFAKVFTQILDSSLAEDYQTRHVFEDLLKLCDINGVVDMTHEAIARRTNVPLEIVRRGIEALERPDTRSRNPEFDGRRIVRLDEHRDWGWMICNYKHYRDIASDEQRREKTLARVKRHREKNKKGESGSNAVVTACNATETQCNADVTDANAINAMQRQKQMQKEELCKQSVPTPAFAEQPGIEEVLIEAQRIGLAEWKARDWFNEMEGCGWLDYNHRPIRAWRAVLARVRAKWEADGRPSQPPSRLIPQSHVGTSSIAEKNVDALLRSIDRTFK